MKVKCIECGVSFFDKPLHRTTEKGSKDPQWMCEECIVKNHDLSLIDEEVLNVTDIISKHIQDG
ncbi:hypothetical protein [Myroides odoratus]|uniref:hypothetical protein n=1 Tax=Myroides odoratus TaxID=256 RepID=UPI000765B524|nr:hypothetical protein [Myroides odoratus]